MSYSIIQLGHAMHYKADFSEFLIMKILQLLMWYDYYDYDY